MHEKFVHLQYFDEEYLFSHLDKTLRNQYTNSLREFEIIYKRLIYYKIIFTTIKIINIST
jgi:hypothetical protein